MEQLQRTKIQSGYIKQKSKRKALYTHNGIKVWNKCKKFQHGEKKNMTTKKNGSKTPKKNAETKTAEIVEETIPEVVELSETQIAMRNEFSLEVFDVPDYTKLNEVQMAKMEKYVSKMKVPRAKKEKAPKEPKRTAGRLIAPTLRVKDENAILQAVYGIKSITSGLSFKGGWGTSDPSIDLNTIMVALHETIVERKIADDTVEVVVQKE